jgi:hypothetical protein
MTWFTSHYLKFQWEQIKQIIYERKQCFYDLVFDEKNYKVLF